MSRTLAACAAATLLLLTGCSSSDDGGDDGSGGSGSAADVHEISGGGVRFEVPGSFEEVDRSEVADGAEGSEGFQDVAERLGMTPEEFRRLFEQADVFVFDQDDESTEFVDNVNVISGTGELPADDALAAQLTQVGADVDAPDHEQTGAGETTSFSYTLELDGQTIEGEGIFVQLDGSAASVTVSTTDRETTDELADGIRASLEQE